MGRKKRSVPVHEQVLPQLNDFTTEDWLTDPEKCFAALEREHPTETHAPPAADAPGPMRCAECEGTNFIYNHEKDYVCTRCGVVTDADPENEKHIAGPEYWGMQHNRFRLLNNYCTLYQLNQIMRRFTLQQSRVEDDDLFEIYDAMYQHPATRERLRKDERLTKKDIYDACKISGHGNLQKKWIDIRRQLQGVVPLRINPEVISYIANLMPRMQSQFRKHRKTFRTGGKERKIFIKITYIVRRMLMGLGHWKDELEEYFPAPPTQKTRLRYDIIYNTLARAVGAPLGPKLFKDVQ